MTPISLSSAVPLKGVELCSRLRSPFDMREVQLQHVPQYHVDRQVLGHEVCTVSLARDLREWNDLLGALLLEPKAVHVDVVYLCYPLAIEDPLGSRCVKLEGNPDV